MSLLQMAHSNHSLRAEEWSLQLKQRRDLACQHLKLAQDSRKRHFGKRHAPLAFLLCELAKLTRSGTFKRQSKVIPTSDVGANH